MQVVYERCCGIDVHKQTVVACAIVAGADGQSVKDTRTFATMSADLEALASWLRGLAVTHVAMKSTGVYWKPVYNLLDGRFAILVVNAEHIKALAGRKTDVQGAERIAELLRHGLLVTGYYLITRQTKYEDLGGNYFDERDREAVKRRAVKRPEKLGYQVQLAPAAVPTG